MNHSDILLENLFKGDLTDMILSVISIDEFESKIDDKIVVLGFYAINDKAAEDLSVYIERSSIKEIIDTEVSLAPNKHGNYIVFIEMDFKDIGDFAKAVIKLVDIVGNLVDNNNEWFLKNYRFFKDKKVKLTEKNIKIILQKIIKERG